MPWIRRTLDHLFSEPSQQRPPASMFSPEAAARHAAAAKRQREIEIEIETRRGVRGL